MALIMQRAHLNNHVTKMAVTISQLVRSDVHKVNSVSGYYPERIICVTTC